MFDVNEYGIHFVGDYDQNKRMSYTVENGDSVTLKIDDEDVNVKDIVQTGDNEYTGIVYDFGSSHGVTFMDLVLEQQVEFKFENIFSCGKQ